MIKRKLALGLCLTLYTVPLLGCSSDEAPQWKEAVVEAIPQGGEAACFRVDEEQVCAVVLLAKGESIRVGESVHLVEIPVVDGELTVAIRPRSSRPQLS